MARKRALAGIIGPAVFTTAAVVAARRAPGYSHTRHHISGLAAQTMPSAPVMIPGFVSFGFAGLIQEVDDPIIQRMVRTAGLATLAAGLARCSTVDCPMPRIDEEATASDGAHAAASVVAFSCWTLLPSIAATRPGPTWYRRTSALLAVLTWGAYAVNSRAVRSRSATRGRAQRLFLVPVFGWYALTSWSVLGSGQAT